MHKILLRGFLLTSLLMFSSMGSALASDFNLTLDIPLCKMPPGKALPAKYYSLANKYKEFRWVNEVRTVDSIAGGQGGERIDGSGIYNWYGFGKLDINGDGWCDWFLTSLAPYSTGVGGADQLNTLYLGSTSGWKRVGAMVPSGKPDNLGWGNDNEQKRFAFSSGSPLVIRDATTGIIYLIGIFNERYETGRAAYGYRLYTWSPHKNTLQELDKWEPGSAAAQVYAFFKQRGAVDPTQTEAGRIVHFDPEFENTEFDRGCKNEAVLKRSIHFAGACKSPRPAVLPPQPVPTPALQTEFPSTPKAPPLPTTFEKILNRSPALKKGDDYLNRAYSYLTGGYLCPGDGVAGCFICGLPLNKIPTVKIEQKRWLTARDKAAKQAGAFGSEPYVAALVKLTTERNSELKKRIEVLQPADPRCKNYLPVE